MASNKATVVFLAIILVVAFIALIMAIIAWADFEIVVKAEAEAEGINRDGEEKKEEGGTKDKPVYYREPGMRPMNGKDRVFVFAYEDYPPQNFLNKGRLAGPTLEIVSAVCEVQRKQCAHVFAGVNPAGCWDDSVGAGNAILSGRFDACANWFGTIERTLVHDFSNDIYRKPLPTKFYRKLGSNVTSLNGAKVAFTSSSRQSEMCARTNGAAVGNMTVVNKDSTTDAMKALADGDVDAAFLASSSSSVEKNKDIEPVPGAPQIACSRTGGAVMVRKGSPILGWFNDGLQQIMDSGKFSAICEAAKLPIEDSCVFA